MIILHIIILEVYIQIYIHNCAHIYVYTQKLEKDNTDHIGMYENLVHSHAHIYIYTKVFIYIRTQLISEN